MGKSKNTAGLTPKQRLLRAVELPLTSVGKSVKITLSDNIRADIEGAQGIIEYDDSIVKLRAGKLTVILLGRDLRITEYSEALTAVEGIINNLSYELSCEKL